MQTTQHLLWLSRSTDLLNDEQWARFLIDPLDNDFDVEFF